MTAETEGPEDALASEIPMTLTVRGRRLIVAGAINETARRSLRFALVEHLTPGEQRIIDLEGVTFFPSAGVGILVGAFNAHRKTGGKARVIASRSSHAGNILRVLGLDETLWPLSVVVTDD